MKLRRRLALGALGFLAVAVWVSPHQPLSASDAQAEPVRRTLVFQGTEREYFVYLPPRFNREATYWPIVVVGGVSGRNFLSNGIAQRVTESGFEAIIISPSFPAEDLNAVRFPALGEGDFLQAVLREVRQAYTLQQKMLLTGYSRGAQFAHRFALTFPEQVRAVAPLASGTWTTPDGRFLVEEIGEVRNPRTFLSDSSNASSIPARLKDLFEPRVAKVAGSTAASGAQSIPFLVMCGSIDPRLPIAKEFVRSLEVLKYHVEVEWPRTPHLCGQDGSPPDCQAEFQKYARGTAAFFRRVTQGRPSVLASVPVRNRHEAHGQ